jgi:hypothetical protein
VLEDRNVRRFVGAGLIALTAAVGPFTPLSAQEPSATEPSAASAWDRAAVAEAVSSFAADAARQDSMPQLGDADADRHRRAIEKSFAEADVAAFDVTAAAVCVDQTFDDTQNDRPFLDGVVYGLSYDCDLGVWAAAVLTDDAWPASDLGYYDTGFDTDTNASTGCLGEEYRVVGLYDTVDARLEAGVIRTPQCATASWTVVGPALIERLGEADFVGVAFDTSLIGSPTTVRWASFLTDLDTPGDDAMPDAGNHTMTVPAFVPPPQPTLGSGYWMVGAAGDVYGFGSAQVHLPNVVAETVAIASTRNGGYWILTSDGRVHSRNAAHFGHANPAVLAPGERFATIAARPQGDGYWIFTDRGRAMAFGAAGYFGDMASTPLNGPVVASTATTSGNGYWMVGSDGGIFSFGDAQFYGSMGGHRLNESVVGIAPDLDGRGYWLVASDGGIFAFDAPFAGSVPAALAPGQRLNKPVIGALAYGAGYLMVASDGGIFTFSDRPFHGSLGSNPPAHPIVGVAIWQP